MKRKIILFLTCALVVGCSFYPKLLILNVSESDVRLSIGNIDHLIYKSDSFDFRFKSESMKVATILEGNCLYRYQISNYLISNQLLEPKKEEIHLIYAGDGLLSVRIEDLKNVTAKRCSDNPKLCKIPAEATCH